MMSYNKIKVIIVILGIILAYTFLNSFNFGIFQKYNSKTLEFKNENKEVIQSLIIGPIYINNSDPIYNWATLSASQSWCSGNGTWEDPYIIEGVTVDGGGSSSCIHIINSRSYFIIRECIILNSGSETHPYYGAGIKLNNTSNGKIIGNNVSFNNGMGIHLYLGIENITITNNIVNNNTYVGIKSRSGITLNVSNNNVNYNEWQGIYLVTNNSIISKNKMIGNIYTGLTLANSYYNNITKNNITDNGYELPTTSYEGIDLVDCYNNTLLQNHIIHNKGEGIIIRWCQFNKILGNKITGNIKEGIYLMGTNIETKGHIIVNNTIKNNNQEGIELAGNTNWNIIYNNTFIGNNLNALDNGNNNTWNYTTIGNYWDDYLGLDANDDGIGDLPYNISGSAGSQDNYPIWWDGPILSINEPQPFKVFKFTAPNFNISINEGVPDTIWYTIDEGKTNYTCSSIDSVNQTAWDYLEHGSVNLIFYANDSKGFIWSNTVIIYKDLKAPHITINSPTPNQLCGITAPTFNLQIIEPNLQEKRYSLNGRPNITFTTETQFNQTEWNQLGNGTISIIFYAIDKVGNTNSSELIVRKDAYVPDIIINSPLDDQKFGKTAPDYNISIIEEDLVSTWYTIEGVAGTFTFTESIGTINQDAWDDAPKGEITITFYAIDNAGNTGSESVVVIKSIPSKPEIPGYHLFILLGILSVVSMLIIQKVKKM